MELIEKNPSELVKSSSNSIYKTLKTGDLFGEVSVLFGCQRTATVKSNSYCECAFLSPKAFNSLISEHLILKRYLQQNILLNYDDELRLFLVSCLRQVDYLSQFDENILLHLAFSMVAIQKDKNSFITKVNDSFNQGKFFNLSHLQQCNDPNCECYNTFIIIFEGTVALFTIIDKTIELPFAYLSRGAVINVHNFLAGYQSEVSIKCLTQVTFYQMNYKKMYHLMFNYPELMIAVKSAQRKAYIAKKAGTCLLDFVDTNYERALANEIPRGVKLSKELKVRIPYLKLLMRKAMLFYLKKLRARQKNSSLMRILVELYEKEKSKRNENVKLWRKMLSMNLS